MPIKFRPYDVFGLMGVFLLLLLFIPTNRTIDIHIHDTVFVIGLSGFLFAFGMFLLALFLVYKITNKVLLSFKLTWIHLSATMLFVILVLIHSLINNGTVNFSVWHFSNSLLVIFTLLFTLSQFLFFCNILAGIAFKFRKPKK